MTGVVRAPLGTIFREDCGEDVEVRPTEVLGQLGGPLNVLRDGDSRIAQTLGQP